MVPRRRRRRRRLKLFGRPNGNRYQKRHQLPWVAGIGYLGYRLLEPKYGLGVTLLLGFVALLIYGLFIMATKCNYEVDGRGCYRDVYGWVNGCQDHNVAKHDAVFAVLGMRNPSSLFRWLWRSQSPGGRRAPRTPQLAQAAAAGDNASNRSQAMFNTASIIVAAVGSIASVLALFLTK